MIENIKNIQIKGKIFQENTILISDNTTKLKSFNFIYGKNGSGKTTLSNGIKTANDDNAEVIVNFLDSKKTILPAIENIYVFNENFIDKRIKIDDDGINSIVLFGKQVDIQKDIDRYTIELDGYNKDLESIRNNKSKFEDRSNRDSIPFIKEQINQILKSKWAIQDSKIKGNKQNSAVGDDTASKIMQDTPIQAKEELEREYEKLMSTYALSKEYNNIFPDTIKQVVFNLDDEEKIQNLLIKKIHEPVLSNRENVILDIIKNFPIQASVTNVEYFKEEQNTICPFCYQDVTNRYKEELFSSISKIFNKDADEHKTELQNLILPNIEICIPQEIEVLDKDLYFSIIDKIEICKNIVKEYKGQINNKVNNLYTPIIDCKFNLVTNLEELNILLDKMEVKRNEHNFVIGQKKQTRDKLIKLNNNIAHYDIKDLFARYEILLKQLAKLKSEEDKLIIKKKECDTTINILKQQKANINIAKEKINYLLRFVFFNKNSLVLESKENQYILKSNGNSVRPSEISTGERNILALCYFFTLINENMDETSVYEKEMLVVFDDPISSFDYNNKIGIMSILTMEINNIMKGNKNSKIILLSHDLSTVVELARIYKQNCSAYILENFKMSELEYTKYNNYKNMLRRVYLYALNADSVEEYNIGNIMRKVLEGFGTFLCNTGIIEIMQYEEVQNKLIGRKKYFNHLMHRLVLHGDSHTEDYFHTHTNDFKFNFSYSKEEKQQIARSIICFIYLVSNVHIYSMLDSKKNDKEKIDKEQIDLNITSWLSQIETDDIRDDKEAL